MSSGVSLSRAKEEVHRAGPPSLSSVLALPSPLGFTGECVGDEHEPARREQ